MGIEKKIFRYIFDRFFKVSKNTKGFGLGLAITDELVKAHGFDVTVKSQINKGSIFCIKIPQNFYKIST